MDPSVHNHVIDKLAFVNSLISGLALYPQVWFVLKTGSIANISLLTFTVILLNSVIWVMYAVHRGLLSLGIASLLNAIASGILIIVIFLV